MAAYYWYRPAGGKAVNVSIGLFVGGTLGNWVDRLRFPGVTDFIDVRLRGDVHWFTFNLADVAILAAIVVFVVVVFGLWPGKAARGEPQTPPGDSTLNR
jgi:lipoprotein signal peptidase